MVFWKVHFADFTEMWINDTSTAELVVSISI